MSRALASAQHGGSGLLKRALELRSLVTAEPVDAVAPPVSSDVSTQPRKSARSAPRSEPEQPDGSVSGLQPESAIRSILRRLPSLPESFEQPAHLFQLLVSSLDLRRAALLLPDYDEDIFVPWASNGLDATSIHRLRIPSADLEQVVASSGAGLVWLGEESREFAPYFSRREASMLEHLLVFPLASDEGLQAVLLVTDTPYFDGAIEYLRVILAAVGEPAAREIRHCREDRLRTMRQAIVFKPSEIAIVAGRIAGRTSGDVRLLSVDLSDIVSQIATSNEYLDSFRVWQDVLRAIAALFASTASVCDTDGHRALLLVHGRTDSDLTLLLHHVGASLLCVFPEIAAVPVLRHVERRFPEDDDDLPRLASSLQ